MARKIIIIAVWIILIAGLGVYMSFTEKQHNAITCQELSIKINYNSDDYFIIENDILQHLKENGFAIKDAQLASIDAGDIEQSLYTNPYVEKADVFVTIDGNVNIQVTQKKPIVKVFNKSGQCYYLDDTGMMIPQCDDYSARLPVAHGEISDFYAPYSCFEVEDTLHPDSLLMQKTLYKVFKMAKFINQDVFWKAMIEEIYVNSENELELFTKIGDATVIFGDVDDMNEKFGKLLVFYKEGLNKCGWSRYKKINLKYKNQVVCSKS